jgi:DNA adenine methylase
MKRELPPLLCRIGSKSRIVNKLLPLIPIHKIYVEPFVGAGAIFFAKQPSDKEYINDLDSGLMDAYKLLKNVSTDIKNYDIPKFIKKTNSKDDEPHNVKLIQDFVNKNHRTNENKLLAKIYLCNTFAGTGKGKIFKDHTQISKIKKIGEYKDRIKNTTISNKDYKTIIKQTDSPNTFYFLDPPYENSKGLYKHSEFNYEELKNILSNIKGKFILTLNDSVNIRNIFKEFTIKKLIVPPQSNSKMVSPGSKSRKELIIMNY